MGFLGDLALGIFNIAKEQVEQVEKKQEQIRKYESYYDRFDDEELFEKFQKLSGEKKIACGNLLKQRGYGRHRSEDE